jgi:hypothetical protein
MADTVKQTSIFLENVPGMLSKVSDVLGKEGINIGAITLAESTEQSIVRMIADNPDKAKQVLSAAGYHVWQRDVIAIEIPDHPGGLNAALDPLAKAGINVHYLYSFLRRFKDNAILIFRVDDTEKSIQVLKENYINLIGDAIYSI